MVNVTGIIDWDEAHFVPRFATCVPPRWLWQPKWWKYNDNNRNEEAEDDAAGKDDIGHDTNEDEESEDEESRDDNEWQDEPLDPDYNAPSTPEEAEIKRAFEGAVGERWVFDATSPWAPLARRLLQFSRRIMYSQQDDENAAEWKKRWGQPPMLCNV
ncbi:uncharacterized protein PG998_009605 [Apiospora kogelbergensis]|uniref:uncharacterized protein n=1 Tax=Apiospora kogelbergensis TaxID=1337665 RepID=UPI0031313F8D